MTPGRSSSPEDNEKDSCYFGDEDQYDEHGDAEVQVAA
jgi:hypothetical protein